MTEVTSRGLRKPAPEFVFEPILADSGAPIAGDSRRTLHLMVIGMLNRPGPSETPRLLLIGIDGADYRITDWLMRQGYLSNLKLLAEQGAWGPARSTIPPLTPAAWTTIMTGKNPGKHGVFDFLPMNGDNAAVPVGARRRAMTLWQGLSRRGYRVGTFNVPVTYPPEQLSGFQVSGFTAPAFGPQAAYPDRAFSVLSEAVRGYEPFPSDASRVGLGERELRDRIDLVPIATRRLLHAFPCDVYMANFQVVDWVQHQALAEEMEPGDVESLSLEGSVARTYQLVDDRIGVLIREWASPDTYVMVVSDHGAAVVDRLVNLEKLFLDHGLMAYTSRTSHRPQSMEAARARANVALRAWSAVKRHTPSFARPLSAFARRMGAHLAAYQADAQIDWSRTEAAPWGLYGQVRLNLRGRDPGGVVSPDRVDALCDRLRSLLLSIHDPLDGQPVYGEVQDAAAVYSGPFVDEGPDLIAIPRDERYLTVCGRMFGGPMLPLIDAQAEVVVALKRPRDFHSNLGVFGAAGPGIEPGWRLPERHVVDVSPTALYLLGEPIPEDMDGHPAVTIVDPVTRESRRATTCATWPAADLAGAPAVYTPEEQQQVEAQLAALGYL